MRARLLPALLKTAISPTRPDAVLLATRAAPPEEVAPELARTPIPVELLVALPSTPAHDPDDATASPRTPAPEGQLVWPLTPVPFPLVALLFPLPPLELVPVVSPAAPVFN